eukprot:COSAG01_NODE_1977_length_8749_cov_2.820809_3_plen_31_part_00
MEDEGAGLGGSRCLPRPVPAPVRRLHVTVA